MTLKQRGNVNAIPFNQIDTNLPIGQKKSPSKIGKTWKRKEEKLGNTEFCLGGFLPLSTTALCAIVRYVHNVASAEFSIQSIQLK